MNIVDLEPENESSVGQLAERPGPPDVRSIRLGSHPSAVRFAEPILGIRRNSTPESSSTAGAKPSKTRPAANQVRPPTTIALLAVSSTWPMVAAATPRRP